MKPSAFLTVIFGAAAVLCAASRCDYKVNVSTDYEAPLKPVSQSAETTGRMEASIDLSGLNLWGRAKRVVFLDSQGNAIQTNEGNAKINSTAGKLKINIEGIPLNFQAIDLWLDELYLGGGDVGGKVIELTGVDTWGRVEGYAGGSAGSPALSPGGGDVGGLGVVGLVLPHLVIRKISGQWTDVSLRLSVENYQKPDGPAERKELVKRLVFSLEAVEDGVKVGAGDAEETTFKNAQAPSINAEMYDCYNDYLKLEVCPGTPDEETCEQTDYCGQDGHYADGYELQKIDDYLLDPLTGIKWDDSFYSCNSVYGCSYAQAVDYCQSRGREMPKLEELRALFSYGSLIMLKRGFQEAPSGAFSIWSSSLSDDGANLAINEKGEIAAAQPDDRGSAVCFKRSLPAPVAESFIYSGVDTISGLMWEEANKQFLWKEALAYCQNLTSAGFYDWRLANIAELSMLNYYPKDDTGKMYVSSTTYAQSPQSVWIYGETIWSKGSKFQRYNVKCVRNIP